MKRRPIAGSDAGDPPEIAEKKPKLAGAKKPEEEEEEEVISSASKQSALPELGEDLVFEILKRADARSLAASACVSRRWRSLAEDERLWEAVCYRHWANIGCGNHRSVVLALGGFRRLYSLHLLPLLRPTAASGRSRPAIPLPVLPPASWGKDEEEAKACIADESEEELKKKNNNKGSKAKLTVGTCVGGATSVIILASIIVFYINKKSSNQEDMRLKVENFLATYQNTKPTRYSFSEIKKITARFKHKLGRGGFGTVYKGELPNGIPVAVKLIEVENSSGEEFINEVATIGRIHHINIVRLLRFCSQRTMLALIYEFMPNESLEKFIFSGESSDRFRPKLNVAQLQQIAVGIAQGIEYLHQGCDQRILHFDIKPHNILLDHSFVPKISDFGFAKLCSRDQSRIPMTVARGTMGYIAPEIYSRNFGAASGKSDVYSFGMLLMEMVSWRKNVDPSIDDQSSVYFPEWIYEQLVRGRDLDLVLEVREDEEEIAKKLIVVALWCVQWSPVDRPSMTRVVQMLLGEFTDLEIPPKPFVSSSLENVVPVNTA